MGPELGRGHGVALAFVVVLELQPAVRIARLEAEAHLLVLELLRFSGERPIFGEHHLGYLPHPRGVALGQGHVAQGRYRIGHRALERARKHLGPGLPRGLVVAQPEAGDGVALAYEEHVSFAVVLALEGAQRFYLRISARVELEIGAGHVVTATLLMVAAHAVGVGAFVARLHPQLDRGIEILRREGLVGHDRRRFRGHDGQGGEPIGSRLEHEGVAVGGEMDAPEPAPLAGDRGIEPVPRAAEIGGHHRVVEGERRGQPLGEGRAHRGVDQHGVGRDPEPAQQRAEQERLVLAVAEAPSEDYGWGRGPM